MKQFNNRYKNYKDKKELCDEVIEHIPRSTLCGWRDKLSVNPNWRPYTTFQYGMCHRIFTDDEENALAEYIIENIIKPHLYFSDRNFVYLANNAFLEKYRDTDDENIPQFLCSHSFVTDFKTRHRITSRRAHFMKRPELLDPDILSFQRKIHKIISQSDINKDSIVINADETSIHIVPKNVQTWAEIGSENIYIHVEDNVKTNFTALLSITSNYDKGEYFFHSSSPSTF